MSAVMSVITTEHSAVILNNVHIDQANAAEELNGRFFNKTNRFAQNKSVNRFKSRIGMLYLILAAITTVSCIQ